MHWCDAESALLIEKLIEKIDSLPILLVIAYRRSIAEETLSPLLSVLRTVKDDGKSFRYCEVEAFSKSEVHELFRNIPVMLNLNQLYMIKHPAYRVWSLNM